MNRIHILCVGHDPEIFEAVEQSVAPLDKFYPIETADSAEEARAVIREILANGDHVGIVLCDPFVPSETGVDIFLSLDPDGETSNTRKVLLTELTQKDASVRAVTEADLDGHITRPWKSTDFLQTIKAHLAQFVIQSGIDPLPYMQSLDSPTINEAIHRTRTRPR